jgi:hypothetical protein
MSVAGFPAADVVSRDVVDGSVGLGLGIVELVVVGVRWDESDEMVPVTWILWLTCWLRLTEESFGFTRYITCGAPDAVEPGRAVDGVAPVPGLGEVLSMSVNTYWVSPLATLGVPPSGVAGMVAGLIVDSFHGFRQPVTVIVVRSVGAGAGADVDGGWLGRGVVGVCADKVRLAATAAHVARIVLLIAFASLHSANAPGARLQNGLQEASHAIWRLRCLTVVSVIVISWQLRLGIGDRRGRVTRRERRLDRAIERVLAFRRSRTWLDLAWTGRTIRARCIHRDSPFPRQIGAAVR